MVPLSAMTVALANTSPVALVILTALAVSLIVLGGPRMRVQDTVAGSGILDDLLNLPMALAGPAGLEILGEVLNLLMALASLASIARVDLAILEKATAEVVGSPGDPMIRTLHGMAEALMVLAPLISADQAAVRINHRIRGFNCTALMSLSTTSVFLA